MKHTATAEPALRSRLVAYIHVPTRTTDAIDHGDFSVIRQLDWLRALAASTEMEIGQVSIEFGADEPAAVRRGQARASRESDRDPYRGEIIVVDPRFGELRRRASRIEREQSAR